MTGLEVSPCGLGQDLLVNRQIRNGLAKLLILFLKLLQLLELVSAHTAVLLPPSNGMDGSLSRPAD